MNDHGDSSVSDVTSQAGVAGDTVGAAGGLVDEAGDAEPVAGHPDYLVDDAVSRLDELDSTDVSGHPAIYEDIHRSLASALDDTPTPQADR